MPRDMGLAKSVGWQNLGGLIGERYEMIWGKAMQRLFGNWASAAQAASRIAQADPERQKVHKKLQALMEILQWIFGLRTKCISSNMPRCQMWIHRKPRILSCCTLPPGTVSDTLAQCDFGTGSFSLAAASQVQWRHFLGVMRTLRRTSIRTGRRVVVITDNARYHHAVFTGPERKHTLTCSRLPAPYRLNSIHRTSWKLTAVSVSTIVLPSSVR